jgi:hypothetical protein
MHAADLETEVPVVLKDIIESVGAGSMYELMMKV